MVDFHPVKFKFADKLIPQKLKLSNTKNEKVHTYSIYMFILN